MTVSLFGEFLVAWVIGYGFGFLVYTLRKVSENVV